MNRLVVCLYVGGGIAAGQMHVFLAQVDLAEQMLLHERMVAQRVFMVNAHVFVQIERADAVKVDHAAVVPLHQHFICRNRGRAGRQTQHAVALAGDLRGDEHACRLAGRSRVFVDMEFHEIPPRFRLLPPL